MKYAVGQIIWAVGKNRPSLQVFQIIEEITKKTIGDEIISYILKSASDSDELLTLENLLKANHVFKSSEEAQVFMLKTASQAIDKAIANTSAIAKEAFAPENNEKETIFEPITNKENTKTNVTKIKLEDGTIANVTLPDVIRN